MTRGVSRWVAGAVFVVIAAGSVVGTLVTGPSTNAPVIEAGFVILLVTAPIGGWLWVTRAASAQPRSRWDLIALWALPFVLAGLFCWSQLRPDGFAPPIEEWGIASALLGIALAVAALFREVNYLRPAPEGRRRRGWAIGIVVVASCGLACCGPALKILADEPDNSDLPQALLESHAAASEWRPLPPGVSASSAPCFNQGMHGKCHDVEILAATDGATRDQLVDRIVAHYRGEGWPLARTTSGAYEGCRPVIGILRWDDHCMRVVTRPESDPYLGAPNVPGTVNVYID